MYMKTETNRPSNTVVFSGNMVCF